MSVIWTKYDLDGKKEGGHGDGSVSIMLDVQT